MRKYADTKPRGDTAVTRQSPGGIDAWPSGVREHLPPGAVFPVQDSAYSAEGIRGGNEHTTYLFADPPASASAAAFTTRVTGAASCWWRVTPPCGRHGARKPGSRL